MKLGPVRVGESRQFNIGGVIDPFQPSGLTGNYGGQLLPAESIQQPSSPDLRELGATGTTVYGGVFMEDYNPDLRGRQGIMIYDRMRKQDGQLKAVLRAIKIPLLAAEWYVKPGGKDKASQRNAAFVEWALFKRMKTPFREFVREALGMIDYGFYPFEKVFELDVWSPSSGRATSRGRKASKRPVVVWDRLAPRHPRTVVKWFFHPQQGYQGLVQQRLSPTAGFEYVIIPANKLLMFTFEEESQNPEGNSILRICYKHWYIKENLIKIDAIQKERHGIGIPIIGLPPGWSAEDKMLANEMGRNLRANEKAHMLRLPGWEIEFAELKGHQVDILKSIEYHDSQMAKSVLATFLDMATGTSGRGGAQAIANQAVDLFLKSLRWVGDAFCENMSRTAIQELVDFNFSDGEYPELKVRNIGENVEWRTLSVALRNMIESDLIRPDDVLEDWLRDMIDMPERDESSDRVIEEREYNAELQQEIAIEKSPAGVGEPDDPANVPNPVKKKQGNSTGSRVAMPADGG